MTNTLPPQSSWHDSLIDTFGAIEYRLMWLHRTLFGWFMKDAFPYAGTGVETTLRLAFYLLVSAPVLAGAFLVSSVVAVGRETAMASLNESWMMLNEVASIVASDSLLLALVFAAWYTLFGVLNYQPMDPRGYRAKGTPSNTRAAWIPMSFSVVTALLPVGYFTLTYLSATYGIPSFGWKAFVALVVVTFLAIRKWKSVILSMDIGKKPKLLSDAFEHATFEFGVFLLAMVGVAMFGGMTMVFAIHAFWMLFLARRLRYTMYQDIYGFKHINPNIDAWGFVARVPALFAVALVTLSGGAVSDLAVVMSFAPLAAVGGYVGYRYYALGGGMKSQTYDSYEQMSEEDKDAYIRTIGFTYFGVTPFTRREEFERAIKNIQSKEFLINKHLSEDFADCEEPVPKLTRPSTDPEEFDPEQIQSDLEAIRDFLDRHQPAHDANAKLRYVWKNLEKAVERKKKLDWQNTGRTIGKSKLDR